MFIVEAIWDYRVYANFVESDEIHRVYDFFNSDRNEFYSSDPRTINFDENFFLGLKFSRTVIPTTDLGYLA